MVRYLPYTTIITAIELAELFFKEIVLRYRVPKGIVSDRGLVFTSIFWSEICYYTKVKRRLSTVFYP